MPPRHGRRMIRVIERPAKLTLGKALDLGLDVPCEDEPQVLIMGEEVGRLSGASGRVHNGLQKDFGGEHVIETPLAEYGIVGRAVRPGARGPWPRAFGIRFNGFVLSGL